MKHTHTPTHKHKDKTNIQFLRQGKVLMDRHDRVHRSPPAAETETKTPPDYFQNFKNSGYQH